MYIYIYIYIYIVPQSLAMPMVCNNRATPVLTRDRGPRNISDFINDVSIHIDWCIPWSSSTILNLVFCQETLIPNVPEAFWKLENIIDTKFSWGSRRADIFIIRQCEITAWIACWGKSRNRQQNRWRRLARKCHINNSFEVSVCSNIVLLLEHCVCEPVFYFLLQDSICLIFLLLLKISIVDTLVLPWLIQLCRTFSCRDGTARCFCGKTTSRCL